MKFHCGLKFSETPVFFIRLNKDLKHVTVDFIYLQYAGISLLIVITPTAVKNTVQLITVLP